MVESSCTEDDETSEEEEAEAPLEDSEAGKDAPNKSDEALEDLFKAAAKDKASVKEVPTVPKAAPIPPKKETTFRTSPVKSVSKRDPPIHEPSETESEDDEDGFTKGRKKGKLGPDGSQAKGHKVNYLNIGFFCGCVSIIS